MSEKRGRVIDYKQLYDKLKDRPAEKWTREIMIFYKLFQWSEHEKEESK